MDLSKVSLTWKVTRSDWESSHYENIGSLKGRVSWFEWDCLGTINYLLVSWETPQQPSCHNLWSLQFCGETQSKQIFHTFSMKTKGCFVIVQKHRPIQGDIKLNGEFLETLFCGRQRHACTNSPVPIQIFERRCESQFFLEAKWVKWSK